MMKVLLVQHGEAKSREQDPERSLTEEGFRKTDKTAAWVGSHALSVTEIRHSGKRRAEETALIFARHLAPLQGVAAADGLNPNDDVRPVAGDLERMQEPVMIVGHLPFLAKLTGLLLTGDQEKRPVDFTNSGVVCLEKEENGWSATWIIVPDLLPE